MADPMQQLYVKSFFGVSVTDAMDQARSELGADALLLNTRETPIEARHLGRYEVVFGRYPEAAATPPASTDVTGSVDDLRQRLEDIRNLVTRMRPLASGNGDSIIVQALTEAGLEPVLAGEIGQAVRQRISKACVREIDRPHMPDSEMLIFEAVAEMKSRFDVAPEIGRVTALVGPPGAGKTTTLIKLAISQGLMKSRAVSLLSIDTQRIAAADQLSTYAAILGVPFQAVESTAALAQAIDSHPADTLILIDTPGYSPAMLRDLGTDLGAFLSRRQNIDTHLVLTASMRGADLRCAAERFSMFRPAKLLFTRVDETSSFAAMFCEAVRSRRPLSFFGNGQAIPEDLEPASKIRIVDSLVSQLPESLMAVA